MALLKISLLGEYELYRLVICCVRFGGTSCLRLQVGQRGLPISHSSVYPLYQGCTDPGRLIFVR
jgi:hypothetical protein